MIKVSPKLIILVILSILILSVPVFYINYYGANKNAKSFQNQPLPNFINMSFDEAKIKAKKTNMVIEIEIPNLIGKSMTDAINMLNEHHLTYLIE